MSVRIFVKFEYSPESEMKALVQKFDVQFWTKTSFGDDSEAILWLAAVSGVWEDFEINWSGIIDLRAAISLF